MYINVYTVIYVFILVSFNIFAQKRNSGDVFTINLNLDKFNNKLIIAIWGWLIVLFMYSGNSAFIYANF